MEHILPRKNRKESQQTRLAYGLTGGALVLLGLKRRSLLGSLISLAGADMVTRGVTGHHLHEALGMGELTAKRNGSRIPHQLGVQVQRSVTVSVPVETTYEFVRNLENLPRFMRHLKSVRTKDEKRSHWVVSGPAGTELEWDAEIIAETPNELISWKSIENPDVESAGSIRFEKAPRDRGTIIRVSLQYMPPAGAFGAMVAKLFGEEPEHQLIHDLHRLKQILETGEIATTRGQPRGGYHARQARPYARRKDESTQETQRAAEYSPEMRRSAAAGSGSGM